MQSLSLRYDQKYQQMLHVLVITAYIHTCILFYTIYPVKTNPTGYTYVIKQPHHNQIKQNSEKQLYIS